MTEEELNKVLAQGQVKVQETRWHIKDEPSNVDYVSKEQSQTIEQKRDSIISSIKQKQGKYRNIKTTEGNLTFDSKKEAERYKELKIELSARTIDTLKLQETFVLQRAFTTTDGKRIKAITYVADFTYSILGQTYVEDVKSVATAKNQVFINKWKMMQEQYPQYKFVLS